MSTMTDGDCVRFLQWALPRLGFRWRGFRKPRRQVCRRIADRYAALGLPDIDAYRALLEADPEEWRVLRDLCRVTISRFRRDHSVWDVLVVAVLPELARRADGPIRAWSCGCASGEEAATLAIAWDAPLDVLGTDIDPEVLARARAACWPDGSLKELPEAWRERGLQPSGTPPDTWCLRERYRRRLRFERSDLLDETPAGPFDLVLCRNLAFTYYAEPVQRQVLDRLAGTAVPGGALVVGRSEGLPDGHGLTPWAEREGIWRL